MNKCVSHELTSLLLSQQLLRSLAGETVNRTAESKTESSKCKKAPKGKKTKRKTAQASRNANRR